MVHQVLEDTPDETILDGLRQRYQGASSAEMAADLAGIHAMVADLSEPGDNYPVTNLTDHPAGRGRVLAAPFRADVVQGDPETIRDLLNRLWGRYSHTTSWPIRRPPAELVRLVEATGDLDDAGLRALPVGLAPT